LLHEAVDSTSKHPTRLADRHCRQWGGPRPARQAAHCLAPTASRPDLRWPTESVRIEVLGGRQAIDDVFDAPPAP
jgi:hypothetical protein